MSGDSLFLRYALEYAMILPGAAICLIPVWDRFRFDKRRGGVLIAGFLLTLIFFGAALSARLRFPTNSVLIPFSLFVLPAYCFAVDLPKRKLLFVFFTGTMLSSVAVSVRGKVREVGSGRIPELFEKNSYMREIYPTKDSMRALTVSQIYEGTGECFDLSRKPIERALFSFGGAGNLFSGYAITDRCLGCGSCLPVCPQACIQTGMVPYQIEQDHCLHCGNCCSVCPLGAVEKRENG